MKTKRTLLLISLGIISATTFGATSAASAITDKAEAFGVKISTEKPVVYRKVTYYIPVDNDPTYKNFTSTTIDVPDGSFLYTVLTDCHPDVDGFKFESWHSSKNHFRKDDTTQDIISNAATITSDMSVYAKYVKTNTLYYYDTTHHYVTSTTNDATISTNTVYIGDFIYSLDGVEGYSKDLITDSGIYKLEKNTDDWNILRKVSFGINAVSSWWTGSSAHTHIYYENTSNVGDFKTNVLFDNNKVTYYFNYDVNKFVVCRSPSNSTDWNQFWNQTYDALLTQKDTGSATYGKEHTTLYVQNDPTDGKLKHYNWW